MTNKRKKELERRVRESSRALSLEFSMFYHIASKVVDANSDDTKRNLNYYNSVIDEIMYLDEVPTKDEVAWIHDEYGIGVDSLEMAPMFGFNLLHFHDKLKEILEERCES